jgi:hypothetical protein
LNYKAQFYKLEDRTEIKTSNDSFIKNVRGGDQAWSELTDTIQVSKSQGNMEAPADNYTKN